MSKEMGLDPEFEYTGGERSWKGNVPRMLLSAEKLMELGVEPRVGFGRGGEEDHPKSFEGNLTRR